MSTGKCNLLLIKTCCWYRLPPDSDSRPSCSHFSSSLPSSISFPIAPPTLAPSSFSRYLNTQLVSPFLSSSPSISNILFSPLFHPFSLTLQSQHHEEEKRSLSREIILLNNHLMEAKITINKLREDNVSTESFSTSCYIGSCWHLCQCCAWTLTCTKLEPFVWLQLRTWPKYISPSSPQIQQQPEALRTLKGGCCPLPVFRAFIALLQLGELFQKLFLLMETLWQPSPLTHNVSYPLSSCKYVCFKEPQQELTISYWVL